jgi:hypothetical protein
MKVIGITLLVQIAFRRSVGVVLTILPFSKCRARTHASAVVGFGEITEDVIGMGGDNNRYQDDGYEERAKSNMCEYIHLWVPDMSSSPDCKAINGANGRNRGAQAVADPGRKRPV